MKNKTVIITLIVVLAIVIAIFFINKNTEIDNTQTPNATTTTPSDKIVETATSTEIVPATPIASSTTNVPTSPAFPETGFEPK